MKYAIGIDIGGTFIKSGLVNDKGEVVYFYKEKTKKGGQEESLHTVLNCVSNVLENSNIDSHDIIGIGVGTPGTINNSTGVVDYANNLGWYNLPLKQIIEEKYGIPTKITNDANAATLGEYKFGVGKTYHNLVMLTIGTGIGGGLIIDDKLFEGNLGKGTELGHITLIAGGRNCTCGRNGCFEQYASATALIRQAKEGMEKNKDSLLWNKVNSLDDVNGEVIFASAKEGDKTAIDVLDQYIAYLSEGILNYCNIFRPDAIILAGGVIEEKEYLIERIVKYCIKYNYGYKFTPAVEILAASLGYNTGVIGAAALFL